MTARPCFVAACLVALLGCDAIAARAQGTVATEANENVVLAADTPMFWLKDTSRTPMRILTSGTSVRLVRQEGGWFRVIFVDPKYGEEAGYISQADLRRSGSPGVNRGGSDVFSQRGYVEGRFLGFAQSAPFDPQLGIGDVVLRDDLFVKPTRWLQFSAGAQVRANSYNQVEDEWRVDTQDRGVLRPRISLRRLTAGITTSHLTVDVGKQFIRWGRADILNPIDRFAPKDFVNVLDVEYLPVIGARSSLQLGAETFEGVWLTQMTPSRLPLINQRWTAVPADVAPGLVLEDRGSAFPRGAEQGFRWTHSGRFEAGASFFNGFNHLPDVAAAVDGSSLQLTRTYSAIRTFGGEILVPTAIAGIKGETAYFMSPGGRNEEYILYVLELERQVGEWILDGGYVGEIVTSTRPGLTFGAERGIGRSFIGRASYAIGPRRSIAAEAAVRQNGQGFFVRGEFSEALSSRLRVTVSAVGIGGDVGDFIGQYNRNSHASAGMRLSF